MAAPQNYRVSFNIPDNGTLRFDLNSSTTILELKEKVNERTKSEYKIEYEVDQYHVLFKGRILQDEKTLEDCNIPNGSMLEKQNKLPITIKPIGGTQKVVYLDFSATVENLKEIVYAKTDIPVHDQRLFFAGKPLSDDKKKCSEYNMLKDSSVQVVQRTQPSHQDWTGELGVRATIVDFYRLSEHTIYKSPTFPSVNELLNKGPDACIDEHQKGKCDFRWIHLPANNMSWVDQLFKTIYREQEAPPSPAPDSSRNTASGETGPSGSEDPIHMTTQTELAAPISNVEYEGGNSSRLQQGPEDDNRYKDKGKSKAIESKTPSVLQEEPQDEFHIGAELLLRPEYWDKREYASKTPSDRKKHQFMKPSYAQISTESSSLETQLFTPIQDKSSSVSLFMPYLDFETMAMHNIRKSRFKDGSSTEVQQYTLPTCMGAELIRHSAKMNYRAHDRRTLDQAFYYTTDVEEIWERDQDQVLWRYMHDTNVPASGIHILMVDQLWLWIVDPPRSLDGRSGIGLKTVVTAFAPRWHSEVDTQLKMKGPEAILNGIMSNHDVTDVYTKVVKAIYGNYHTSVISPPDLVCLIIDKCAGLFHPLPDEGDTNLDYLDVFEIAISNLASKQTKLSDSLWNLSKLLGEQFSKRETLRNGPLRTIGDSMDEVEHVIDAKLRSMTDITSETASLKEIKDVLDELNSIANVFHQQIAVVKLMVDNIRIQTRNERRKRLIPERIHMESGNSKNFKNEYPTHKIDTGSSNSPPTKQFDDQDPAGINQDLAYMEVMYEHLLGTLKQRLGDIESLDKKASKVYNDLRDLLDLKQKQASLSQALYARQEAQETARQGKTLMLFTIVTIIFLPLSFIAAIFSMNAREIIPDSDRPIGQIFKIMFPTTAVITIVSLVLAYRSSIRSFVATLGDSRRDRRKQNTLTTSVV